MTKEKEYTEPECHRKFAVNLSNLVWRSLDKKDRTKEEDDKIVHAAHASRFHWDEIGKPINLGRGEWQISRVYSVLNRPESALYHAKRYLEICKENSIGGFDLAYEAIARAYAVAGKKDEADKYMELAKEAGEQNEEKEDKNLLYSDLETISGYKKG
jgi:hypothetical protein